MTNIPAYLKFITVLTFIILFSVEVKAQDSKTVQATSVSEQIRLDGHLNEDSWTNAPKIKKFIQREQQVGEPATEDTEVAILYDKNNLYIGVWCYQKDPGSIRAKYMQRDFARASSLRLLRERQGLVAFIHERAKVWQLLQQCIR